jgi:nucleotide-binding universal stress UspA family protein
MANTTDNTDDPVAAWTLHKRRVLVPFDFSEASRKALHVARTFVPDLGTPTGGTISVIHVITPPPITAPGRLLRGPFDEERAIAQGFTALRQALADAQETEFEAIVRVASNPAEEIVAFAERERTELILISSHARKGFDRWLIGSTAERVVRLAPCPVLVLRGPKPQ